LRLSTQILNVFKEINDGQMEHFGLNRKILIAIAAVIAIAVVITSVFIVLNETPAHITITYTYVYGSPPTPEATSYNGTASWVVFTLNATTTKNVGVFNLATFTVKSKGQFLTVLKVNSEQISLYNGKFNEGKVGFIVKGDVNAFELVYNGTSDVTIINP